MILSVSRRTDIPAFYSEWFLNRVKEGFVYVRNPMNIHQISRVPINPKVVDCIVFWTKNPKAMLSRLDELDEFKYYFQYTINPYDKRMEVKVPKKDVVIDTFIDLSKRIGTNRVIWRYDPILLTDKIDIDYHVKYFEELAKRLSGFTKRCVISFIDNYQKTERNLKGTYARELTETEIYKITDKILPIAQQYGMIIQTCSENIDLESHGIGHGKCIDNEIVEELLGSKIHISKDKSQRKECGCVQSIDIGEYNTCGHNCLYCYANFNNDVVLKNRLKHDPESPLLTGQINSNDIIKERAVCPLKKDNLLF
ncbi:DUF1848 domain-containing protein [Paludibacter jiangxiensis]|uniref:DUF1848 domain-containing protein n=1 Tax=Paludibacter jiangxiensis TaxID=681398 RepID=A0A170ZSL5_9BACT|nr:DUF1848 domain-containing protein [Paludibacter jiangxiensis]GAT62973.1 hypothetical protein PJIAN_3285 [Paludibacter jiangxiensis]